MSGANSSAFPVRWRGPRPKPVKGTATIARKDRSKARMKAEDENKTLVRQRDKKCRLPHCPYCKAYKGLVAQAAHVLEAKGSGGDPNLERSQPEDMMLLDPLAHAAQERHEWEIEPLTSAGTAGICAFYRVSDVYDPDTGARSSERKLWDREVRIGVPEHSRPQVRGFLVAKRLQDPD